MKMVPVCYFSLLIKLLDWNKSRREWRIQVMTVRHGIGIHFKSQKIKILSFLILSMESASLFPYENQQNAVRSTYFKVNK